MSPHERHAHGPSHDAHHTHDLHHTQGRHRPHGTPDSHPTHDGGADTAPPILGAVITVSDRSAAGEREDVSGPLAASLLAEHGVQAGVRVVPDGVRSVREAILATLAEGARVVLTTGGTGVGPRDRTPEGTTGVLDLELPGLAQAIRDQGARVGGVASACLSRGVAGAVLPGGRAGLVGGAGDRAVHGAGDGATAEGGGTITWGGAVVVNAPGSPGGVRDAVAVLGPLAAHLIGQLDGGDH